MKTSSTRPKRFLSRFGLSLALVLTFPSVAIAGKHKDAEILTHSLVKLNANYLEAAPSERSKALDRLIDKTVVRQAILAELIEIDPGAVLRIAIPDRIRMKMPQEVQAFIERRVELKGNLEVLYEDHADGSYRLRHSLRTDSGLVSLHFNQQPAGLQSGFVGQVEGVLINDAMAVKSSENVTVQACCNEESQVEMVSSSPELPHTMGEQTTLVLLVNFQDDPANKPWTTDSVDSLVFGQVNDFYRENSYQQTWLSGQTRGWFTLPMDSVCDRVQIQAEADAAAIAAGIDVDSYDRVIYNFPSIACGGAAGFASIGRHPSHAWINGEPYLNLVAHELGHNFGLDHSRGLNCSGGVITEDCEILGYGDGMDVMGNRAAHFNAYQKERLGWLGYGDSPGITPVTDSGTFLIEPYETVSREVKALKVLKDVDPSTGQKTWYYIDFRQPIGFDGALDSYYLDEENVFGGILFRKFTEDSVVDSTYGSFLLDMTPDSDADLWGDLDDPALVAGASYTDSEAGLTLTTLQVGATGATVSVDYGEVACVRSAPGLSLSPGESDWVPAGTAVEFVIELVNNDSQACTSSSYGLEAGVRAGWSTAFSQAELTIEPGASSTTTLSVTSAQDELDGFYPIDVNAVNRDDASYSSSQSVTYVVSNPVLPSGNNPPNAMDDHVVIESKSATAIMVLTNDFDPDGDTLSISDFSDGAKGTVTYDPAGYLVYTPGRPFKDRDSFSYTVSDGEDTDTALVSINLQAPPDDGDSKPGGGKGKKK